MKRWNSLAILFMIVAAPLATAQESGPITWLAFETTKSGKSRDLISATIKDDGPMYDGLLADGTLMSWGIAIPIIHSPRDNMNFMLWATMSDWGKVSDLEAGFMKLFASRTPEQMAASQKAYDDAVEPGSHHDSVIRQGVYRQADDGQPPRYLRIGYYKASTGNAGKLTEAYKKYVQPVYEKLMADGVISGYGLAFQDVHGGEDWTHAGWYSMSNLGATDTVEQAVDAVFTPEVAAEVGPLMDPSGHHDQVLLIVHIGGMTPEM